MNRTPYLSTVNRDVQTDNNNEDTGAGDTTKSTTTAVHHAGTPQAQQAGPNDGRIEGLMTKHDFLFIGNIFIHLKFWPVCSCNSGL